MMKDLFEENMRITGRAAPKPRHQGRNRMLLQGTVFLMAIFGYSIFKNMNTINNQSLLLPPESFSSLESSKGTNPSSPALSIDEPTAPPAGDYQALLDQSPIPLRDVFGLKVGTIVIDPGHGGDDPGTSGHLGTKEKDLTLDIARRLQKRLSRHSEFLVLMTRAGDETVPLDLRIQFANSQKTDLFISLHVNYIPSKPYSVIETYYFGPRADKRSLLLAEKENRGSEYTLNDFRSVIQKINSTLKFQESRILAQCIQSSLYGNIHRHKDNVFDYGVKTAPFVVLLGVDMPSVLTEVTCLSDPDEEHKLAGIEYREDIARFIEEGIVDYLSHKNNPSQSEVIDAIASGK